MPSPGPPPALPAVPDVNVELPADRPAGDLGLELGDDFGFVQRAPAVGTGVGQGGLVGLVDLPGGRGRPVAVLFAGLASGALGVGPGGPLRKGAACRLPARRDSSGA
jgi:hypothetical protein